MYKRTEPLGALPVNSNRINQPQYEARPTSPLFGIFEHAADEPVVCGIGSREAAVDLAAAMNREARERLEGKQLQHARQ